MKDQLKRDIQRRRDDVRRSMRRPLSAGRMLKWLRVVVSVLMTAGMTTIFVTAEGWIARALGWMPKMQILPLAISGAVTLLISWLVFTLIFGRIYCSWVCPMGTTQDVFIRLRHLTRRQRSKHPFHFAAASNKTRYGMLMLTVGSMIVGMSLLATLLDPYSAFGRIAGDLVRPAVDYLCGDPVVIASALAMVIAAVTLVAVGVTAFLRGRLICNTVCPVGSTLGLFSRFSLFHMDIDTDLCINCRKCERVCKAQCINLTDHTVDGSRCVDCFNCVSVCGESAISYTTRRKRLAMPMMQPIENPAPEKAVTTPESLNIDKNEGDKAVKIDRRQFMATGLILAATPAIEAARKKAMRVQALTHGGPAPAPLRYVAPPGRRHFADFLEKCTGCGLCISRCPGKVLKPSANQFGWLHALHPVMDYDHSYCRYNCTRCTQVCPTGALEPLTEDEKHIFIIGHAETDHTNCIGCSLCAERCPRKAITMVARQKGAPGQGWVVPQVDTDLCIGCGACQYICPATPMKAIWVNGIV